MLICASIAKRSVRNAFWDTKSNKNEPRKRFYMLQSMDRHGEPCVNASLMLSLSCLKYSHKT